MNKTALIIMGAGAMARECLTLVRMGTVYHRAVCVGVASDGDLPWGVTVTTDLQAARDALKEHEIIYVVCVGTPSLRDKLYGELYRTVGVSRVVALQFGDNYGSAHWKTGSIIFPHSVLATGSVIGCNAFVNFNCTIGHDSIVGESSVIAPGVHIGGHTVIGKRVFVGIGACIRDHVTIGDDSVIGAGAAVVTNIPANVVVTGVPAKVNRLLTELRQQKTEAK